MCSKNIVGRHPGFFILFDKCQGKTCPDSGKVRKIGRVKCLEWEGVQFDCGRCGRMAETFWDRICMECFYEVKKEKSCVCPFMKLRQGKLYFCSLCDEFHYPKIFCKECARKQETIKNAFFYVGLPSMAAGIIIGFFLCWLFLKIRQKKRKFKKDKKSGKENSNISRDN